MSALTKTTKKNRSGCVGVSKVKRRLTLRTGTVIRRWWLAQCGDQARQFSVDALGNEEAFREAVRCRAEWVRQQAPRELARKKAKKRRNFQTYKGRYAEIERARQRAYFLANRDSINAVRRRRYKARRAAK